MAVTRKTSYALRALYEIGLSSDNKPVSRMTIAEKQHISSSYLEHILIDLQKSNLIKSVRGPGGGFLIDRAKDQITVWDVFSAVEKSNNVYDMYGEVDGEESMNSNMCRVRYIWDDINSVLEEKMISITLKDIIEKEQCV